MYSVRWRQKVKRLTGLERNALVYESGVVQHVEMSGCELGLADEFELLNESVDFQFNTVGR